MTMIPQILKETRAAMDKAIDASRHHFAGVRAGKASPAMLDVVKVEMYGTTMPLNQVATINSPEPRLLLVTPFDKNQIKVIEKAIRESDLGLEPATQGGVIRVPLPALNEQRRKELVKHAEKDLQKLHDDYIHKVDGMVKAKEAEIMEV